MCYSSNTRVECVIEQASSSSPKLYLSSFTLCHRVCQEGSKQSRERAKAGRIAGAATLRELREQNYVSRDVLAADIPMPAAPSLLRVQELPFGQSLILVGSHPALGGWDETKGPRMTWGDGHVWTAEVGFTPGTAMEFKVVCSCLFFVCFYILFLSPAL